VRTCGSLYVHVDRAGAVSKPASLFGSSQTHMHTRTLASLGDTPQQANRETPFQQAYPRPLGVMANVASLSGPSHTHMHTHTHIPESLEARYCMPRERRSPANLSILAGSAQNNTKSLSMTAPLDPSSCRRFRIRVATVSSRSRTPEHLQSMIHVSPFQDDRLTHNSWAVPPFPHAVSHVLHAFIKICRLYRGRAVASSSNLA
jgi:hypothetical protein